MTSNPMPHNCGLYTTTAGWCAICGPNPLSAAAQQPKPCPACAEKGAELVRLTAHADFCRHDRNEAEARATAAEQERDKAQRGVVGLAEQAQRERQEWQAKLAAAEQREAETRGLIDNLKAHAKEHGWQDVDEPIAALLASPSTPSPAPSAQEPTP